MGLRIYVAAPWVNKPEARAAAERLIEAGHTITEPWWEHPETNDPVELQTQALRDITGVVEAQLMIVLQLGPSEGKAVETGIAMMAQVPVIVVNAAEGGRGIGKAANLFQVLLPIVDSLDAVFPIAEALEAQYAATAQEQAQALVQEQAEVSTAGFAGSTN